MSTRVWDSSRPNAPGRCVWQHLMRQHLPHSQTHQHTQVYSNGDEYEGLWDSGRPNGPGRYVWADGNEYDGEWHAGKMEGQGTFVWSTGERFDGQWKVRGRRACCV